MSETGTSDRQRDPQTPRVVVELEDFPWLTEAAKRRVDAVIRRAFEDEINQVRASNPDALLGESEVVIGRQ
jgi:hypothetical protein